MTFEMTNITFVDIITFFMGCNNLIFKSLFFFVLLNGYKATMTQNFNDELLIQMTEEVRGLGTRFSSYIFVFRYLYLPECLDTIVIA